MARIRCPLDPHGHAAQVLQQLKREPAGWRRERLLAVKLGLEGELDLEEIAAHLGRVRSCIQGWLDRFRRGGLDALLQAPKRARGPPPPCRPTWPEGCTSNWRRAPSAERLTPSAGCWKPAGCRSS